MENFEPVILKELIHNEEYMRKVYPYLKVEYFSDKTEKCIFKTIHEYIEKYNARPSKEAILISVNSSGTLNEGDYALVLEYFDGLDEIKSKQNNEWLVENTETFCQNKAVRLAIQKAIKIYEGKNENVTVTAIPQLLMDAVAVSFDSNIGHDYIEQVEDRFDLYHQQIDRIPFDLDILNKITTRGTPKKTLNIVMAGINTGKSLGLCHFASSALSMGKNVLYITLEMSEEKIAERIDANLMNVDIDDLPTLDKSSFMNRFDMRIVKKTRGKLIIKEYPTSTAHVGHFRHLLNELRLKKKFVPDIIFVDYINICASQRLKLGGTSNSYTVVKAIAEELRGLAVEKDVPIWSATQANRAAQRSADMEMDDTSESMGLPAVVDFMIAIMEPEDLKPLGQFLCKQLKNRYRDKNKDTKFVVGVDKGKQRLFDVSDATQSQYIINGGSKKEEPDVPSFDKGSFGSRLNRGGKERAEGFNFNV